MINCRKMAYEGVLIRCCVFKVPSKKMSLINIEQDLIEVVATEFKTHRRLIPAKDRSYPLPDARRVTVALLKRYTNYSYEKIGKIINRDHSMITSYSHTFDSMMKTDKFFKAKYEGIQAKLDEVFLTKNN